MESLFCGLHGKKTFVLKGDSKYICRICAIRNKEQIEFLYDNFDKIQNINETDIKYYEDKLKDYEGYNFVNNAFIDIMKNFKFDSHLYDHLMTNKERFKVELKQSLQYQYKTVTEKFEKTVDELNEKTDKLDISLKSAKEEIDRIESSLTEQMELLENKEKLKEELSKINIKFNNKFKYLTFEKLIAPDLKINFGKYSGNINFRNGSNIIIATRRNTGSYWCECSDEIFEGPLFVRLRINRITRKNDWSLNIGLQRANSVNTTSYYTDGVFFMCSGRITTQFQGNQGRNMHRELNDGDEILIRRDETNAVYFGLNDESTFTQAYTNIAGAFRVCVGFSTACDGDNIEILETDH